MSPLSQTVAGPPPGGVLPNPAATSGQSFLLAALDQQGKFNRFTGQYSLHPVDLRESNSLQNVQRIRTDAMEPGLLGRGWRLNWEVTLVQTDDQPWINDAGLRIEFRPNEGEGGSFWSPGGERLTLSAENATCHRPDGTKDLFDSAGRLIQRRRHGVQVSLQYDSNGRLNSISGTRNSGFTLHWDGFRVTRVEGTNGTGVSYLYHNDQLSQVRVDGQASTDYVYGPSGRLDRIVSLQFGTIELVYDEDDRVIARRWEDGSEEHVEFHEEAGRRSVRHVSAEGDVTSTVIDTEQQQMLVTLPSGRTATLVFDTQGSVVRASMPQDTATSFDMHYDRQGRLVSLSLQDQSALMVDYDADGLPNRIAEPGGMDRSLIQDEQGRPSRLLMNGGEITVRYDDTGLPSAIESDLAPGYQFRYDSDGRIGGIRNAAGRTAGFNFDAKGNLVSQTDFCGHSIRREFNAAGNLILEEEPDGAVTRYEFTPGGQLSGVHDANNHLTRIGYSGRSISVTNPLGETSILEYNSSGEPVREMDAMGNATDYQYDGDGNLVRVENAAGGSVVYEYDARGLLQSETYSGSGSIRYIHDGLSRLSEVVDPDGRRTRYEYDLQGHLSRSITPDGRRRIWNQTPAGPRLQSVVPVTGPALQYEYDAHGNLRRTLEGERTSAIYEYDFLNRCIRIVNEHGLSVTFNYDPQGRMTFVSDSLGGRLSLAYSPVGNLLATTRGSSVTRYDYDKLGNLFAETDPLGNVARREYDAANRLKAVVMPSGRRIELKRDKAGRVTAVTDAQGATLTYTRDAVGNVTSIMDPLGRRTTHQYDSSGHEIESTDGMQRKTRFAYDPTGKLVETRLADGNRLTYQHDSDGNLAEVDDGNFPVRYQHDHQGRLLEIEYPQIGRRLRWNYGTTTGLLDEFVDSEGNRFHYEYEGGRLVTIRGPKGSVFHLSWDAKDRLRELIYPNGIRGDWNYDVDDRLTSIIYRGADAVPVDGQWYFYDAAGRIVRKQTLTADITYGYDADGRLTMEHTQNSEQVRYDYDASGNRLTKRRGSQETHYQNDAAGQLVTAGSAHFEYDANGNLVRRTEGDMVSEYHYDLQDRLVEVCLPNGTFVRYGYAPGGQRIWRETAEGRTWYVSDGLHVWAELDQELRHTTTYLHAVDIDRPLMTSSGDQDYFCHADLLGTITSLTDRNGATRSRYDYDAFGVLTKRTPDAPPLSLGFTGRPWDSLTGLYDHRARSYDPELGRFLSVDSRVTSFTNPHTLNVYSYADNAPTRFRDPLGQGVWDSLINWHWAEDPGIQAEREFGARPNVIRSRLERAHQRAGVPGPPRPAVPASNPGLFTRGVNWIRNQFSSAAAGSSVADSTEIRSRGVSGGRAVSPPSTTVAAPLPGSVAASRSGDPTRIHGSAVPLPGGPLAGSIRQVGGVLGVTAGAGQIVKYVAVSVLTDRPATEILRDATVAGAGIAGTGGAIALVPALVPVVTATAPALAAVAAVSLATEGAEELGEAWDDGQRREMQATRNHLIRSLAGGRDGHGGYLASLESQIADLESRRHELMSLRQRAEHSANQLDQNVKKAATLVESLRSNQILSRPDITAPLLEKANHRAESAESLAEAADGRLSQVVAGAASVQTPADLIPLWQIVRDVAPDVAQVRALAAEVVSANDSLSKFQELRRSDMALIKDRIRQLDTGERSMSTGLEELQRIGRRYIELQHEWKSRIPALQKSLLRVQGLVGNERDAETRPGEPAELHPLQVRLKKLTDRVLAASQPVPTSCDRWIGDAQAAERRHSEICQKARQELRESADPDSTPYLLADEAVNRAIAAAGQADFALLTAIAALNAAAARLGGPTGQESGNTDNGATLADLGSMVERPAEAAGGILDLLAQGAGPVSGGRSQADDIPRGSTGEMRTDTTGTPPGDPDGRQSPQSPGSKYESVAVVGNLSTAWQNRVRASSGGAKVSFSSQPVRMEITPDGDVTLNDTSITISIRHDDVALRLGAAISFTPQSLSSRPGTMIPSEVNGECTVTAQAGWNLWNVEQGRGGAGTRGRWTAVRLDEGGWLLTVWPPGPRQQHALRNIQWHLK